MLVMPAVDIREGACVQLVGGDPTREAVRLPDPAAAAAHWVAQGFSALHVVDLDAALAAVRTARPAPASRPRPA